jgi:hypothetical protein
MSELVYDKVLRETIKDLVGEKGNIKPLAQRIIDSYSEEFKDKVQTFVRNGGNIKDSEIEFLKEYKEGMSRVIDTFTKSFEFKDILYKKNYEELKASGKEGSTYYDLLSEIYMDSPFLSEIFIRIVEETEGVEITNVKQLQELTGITEVYGDPEEEGYKELTKQQAKKEALKQLEEIFISGMSYRYSATLENLIQEGATYTDLLNINPSVFNLPDTWTGTLANDKYTSILWAIAVVFRIYEPATSVKPSLKFVAKEINAPLSVLMDVNKICHQWTL